ncbi:hypothetical protein [Streptomyces ehimensis]|uniref:Uncharacterized protein n=1 Tax=Streptomyces ehimensis TaxID=68195 RepID=A0ABV9BEV1_9ACTN
MTAKSLAVRDALGFSADQYREWVAAHELGHAIASIGAGERVKEIEIVLDRDGPVMGRTVLSRWGRRDRMAALVGLHGGHVADELWLRARGLWSPERSAICQSSSRRDYEQISQLAESGTESAAAASAARRHIETNWSTFLAGLNFLATSSRLPGRALRVSA